MTASLDGTRPQESECQRILCRQVMKRKNKDKLQKPGQGVTRCRGGGGGRGGCAEEVEGQGIPVIKEPKCRGASPAPS